MTDAITTIHHHGADDVRLRPGERLTFGRAGAADGADEAAGEGGVAHIGLSDSPRLHAVAGAVEATEDGWVLVNLGRWLHVRLARTDGPDRTDIAPGRRLRVPWPRVRVEVATGTEVVGLTVSCPALAHDATAVAPPVAGDTVGGLGLDRGAGYFRALVALCEPRLRDPASVEVATVAQVARALSRLPGEPDRVSIKAVERRLAHVRSRVAIGGDDPDGVSAAGLEVRDASRRLVDLALRTGTVTVADLALLDPADAGPVSSVADDEDAAAGVVNT